MSADEISELRKQLAGKDDILNTMKIKTKEFVQKLKDDHSAALSAAEQSLVAATQVGLDSLILHGCRLTCWLTATAEENHRFRDYFVRKRRFHFKVGAAESFADTIC